MLMQKLEDMMFHKGAPQGIRHLAKPDLSNPDPRLRGLFDQIRHEFQLAPPVTIHASDPDLLAGYWHAAREAYVVGREGRAMREAVAAAVSSLNTCPYCVTVHSGMFAAAGGGDLAADSTLPPDVRTAQAWAAATLRPGDTTLANPAFPKVDVAQVFATAVLYHYTNRLVSVFLDKSPMPVPGMASPLGSKLAKKAMAIMGRRIAGHAAKPGLAVLRVEADLPAQFAWARGNGAVAAALAHFADTAQAAGENAVPARVRLAVLDHLEDWQGEQVPLSRAWLEDPVAGLPQNEQPAARLALLTARAPWQVDDAVVAAFRRTAPGDKALIQTAAWAAFATARRIGGWFPGADNSHLARPNA